MGADSNNKINIDFSLNKKWYCQGEEVKGELFLGENNFINDKYFLSNITPYIYIEEIEYYNLNCDNKTECEIRTKKGLFHKTIKQHQNIAISPNIKLPFSYIIPRDILPTFQSPENNIQVYHKIHVFFPGTKICKSKLIGIINIQKMNNENKLLAEPYITVKEIPIKKIGILNLFTPLKNLIGDDEIIYFIFTLNKNSFRYDESINIKININTKKDLLKKISKIEIKEIRRIITNKNQESYGIDKVIEENLNVFSIPIEKNKEEEKDNDKNKDNNKIENVNNNINDKNKEYETDKGDSNDNRNKINEEFEKKEEDYKNFTFESNIFPQNDYYLMNFLRFNEDYDNGPQITNLKKLLKLKLKDINKGNYLCYYFPNFSGNIISCNYFIIIKIIFNDKFISDEIFEIPVELYPNNQNAIINEGNLGHSNQNMVNDSISLESIDSCQSDDDYEIIK